MSLLHRALLGAGCAVFASAVAAQDIPQASDPATGRSFNPKISLILNGLYATYREEGEAEIPGFILGPETELPDEGFSLGESELVVEANIDHRFHGWAAIALEQEDGETVVAVEEAYIDTLALPHGLSAKFGRFLSDIGYLNRQHAHAWDFVDAPLVYRSFLGKQLNDDGLQLRWVAPTDLFVEAGAEALRGDGFPAGNNGEDDIGAWTTFLRMGGDVGKSHAWRFGLWHFDGQSSDRRTGEDVETGFTGDSRISGLDVVYKWAPNGNAQHRHLILQTEVMRRREDGLVVVDPDGNAPESSRYDGKQWGGYVQAIYQFAPRWRVGLRYDRLSASNRVDNPVPDTALALLADTEDDPQRASAMLDYSPSEYSRFRLQYNRDDSRPDGVKDHQILLQYVMSLGSHPAHQF